MRERHRVIPLHTQDFREGPADDVLVVDHEDSNPARLWHLDGSHGKQFQAFGPGFLAGIFGDG